MKYFKFLLIIGLITSTVACKKDRYPEFENSANAQFTRTAATGTVAAPYNSGTLSKAAPATADQFLLKVVESGNVKSIAVMVDYRKVGSTAVITKKYADITTWPQTYSTSLNALVALFAADGVTVANLTATVPAVPASPGVPAKAEIPGDRFVFRIVITLNSGTVISEQAAIMNAAPYAITLTYTVAA
jgi:hypothetical protein